MTSPQNNSSPAHNTRVPANVGVRLRRRAGSLLVFPQRIDGGGDIQTRPPFELPRVFGGMIERAGGVTRCFWRRQHRSIGFLLYLNLENRMWLDCPPPQFCAPADVRLNATFGTFDRPPDTHRLAGSIRSLPNHTSEQAMLALPPLDGLHLVFDPCRAWLAFSAFLCMEGRLEPIVADAVVLDESNELLDALGDRIWVADQL